MFKHVCSILNESLLSLASLKRFMVGEQGWGARDGAVGGALASYQYGLGSNPASTPLCGCATSKSLFIDLFIIVAKKDKQVNNVLCIII